MFLGTRSGFLRPIPLSVFQFLVLCTCLTGFHAVAHSSPSSGFHPGKPWPDADSVYINAHGGGILYHDNTYFWFGEHKSERSSAALVGITCYSSTDLVHWKNKGVVLSVSDDPLSDIVRGCVMERPKVVYNRSTGKFILYFHLELNGQGYSAARVGIAVSDRVTGPYT